MSGSTKYWLLKSEPDCFSIDDLAREKNKTTCWDGVRNYQARNYIRDDMHKGDKVLFYHSSTNPPGVAGVAKIVKDPYPDFTAFDPKDKHFDPKSRQESPRWFMVDIKLEKKLKRFVSLDELRKIKSLEGMVLLQKGSRLSVQPVTQQQFEIVCQLADKPAPAE